MNIEDFLTTRGYSFRVPFYYVPIKRGLDVLYWSSSFFKRNTDSIYIIWN